MLISYLCRSLSVIFCCLTTPLHQNELRLLVRSKSDLRPVSGNVRRHRKTMPSIKCTAKLARRAGLSLSPPSKDTSDDLFPRQCADHPERWPLGAGLRPSHRPARRPRPKAEAAQAAVAELDR